MSFEGLNNFGVNDVKKISENKNSDSLMNLKNDITREIEDKELQTEAQKELQEFKNKLEKNKNLILSNSTRVLKDIKDELLEDLNALNKLEDKFEQFPGYQTFKKIFLNIPDNKKEIVYDLVESGEFEKYIKRRLKGQMFPDSEKLNDFLTREQKFGKVENSSQDSDIKEVFDLQINDLGFKELKYYDNKISELIKITGNRQASKLEKIKYKILEIIERKNKEIFNNEQDKIVQQQDKIVQQQDKIVQQQDKIVQQQDKIVQQQDKIVQQKNKKETVDTVKQKRLETLFKKKDIFINVVEKAFDNYDFVDEKTLRDKLNLLKNTKGVNQLTDKIRDELIVELKKGDNLRNIVSEAKKSGKYREVRKFLVALGETSGDKDFVLKLGEIEKELDINPIDSLSVVRQNEIKNFIGDSDYEIVGDKVIADGKEIDFSEEPPKAYLVGENGYKLETDMQKIDDKKEIILERRELQKVKNELKDLVRNYKQKLDRLKFLLNIQKENLNPKQKNEIDELKKDLIKIKAEIEKLKEKAKKIRKKFEERQDLFDAEEQAEIEEKQEKQRRILKFLSKIGWDLIPEFARKIILKELKNGNYLAKGVGIIPGNIDIKNGLFGESISEAGNKGEKIFAKLMNKIVTGNNEGKYTSSNGEEEIFINLDNIGEDVSSSSDLGNIGGYNASIMRQKMIDNGMYGMKFNLNNVKNNLMKDVEENKDIKRFNEIVKKYKNNIDNYSEAIKNKINNLYEISYENEIFNLTEKISDLEKMIKGKIE